MKRHIDGDGLPQANIKGMFLVKLDLGSGHGDGCCMLVDRDFRIYKVDSSMAFHPENALLGELDPPVYSRRFLTALESLDRAELEERLNPSLLKSEIRSLWERRQRILDRARKLVAEHGEDKILY